MLYPYNIHYALSSTVETAVKKLLVSTCTARVTTAYLACLAFNDITICPFIMLLLHPMKSDKANI